MLLFTFSMMGTVRFSFSQTRSGRWGRPFLTQEVKSGLALSIETVTRAEHRDSLSGKEKARVLLVIFSMVWTLRSRSLMKLPDAEAVHSFSDEVKSGTPPSYPLRQ